MESESLVQLPPGQRLAAPGKWPSVGEKAPRQSSDPWRVEVCGLVQRPQCWSLDELRALGLEGREVDIHCVTRWSLLGARFTGVPLARLVEEARPLPEARFVSFVARSERYHSASLPLADALSLGVLVALDHEGEPLEPVHGGPVRVVTPGRYFYKSVKWLERIELLAEDRLGYWEAEAGYHNEADPWREQRYVAAAIHPRELRAALESRDVSGRNLLSLEAAGMALPGLRAAHSFMRNADFRGANLCEADFSGANLSNAHFASADLRGASFAGGDLEGADFAGADLRGADFTGASLFGVTFTSENGPPARIDPATRFDQEAIESLAPDQREFALRSATGE